MPLIIKKDNTVVKGFRLPEDTAATLEEMAQVCETTQVKIIIALINQYGPAVIAEYKKQEEAQ